MMKHWHEDDVGKLTPEYIRMYCQIVPEYATELDDFGYTPLLAACIQKNAEVAGVLLNAGADPNFLAPDGETPLKAAIPDCGEPLNRTLFDLLFAAGADPNAGLMPPLHIAVARASRDAVIYLVEHGADPNLDDVDGAAPLFWAAGWGKGPPDIKMMRLLIRLGADVARCDCFGRTVSDRIGAAAMAEVLRSPEGDE